MDSGYIGAGDPPLYKEGEERDINKELEQFKKIYLNELRKKRNKLLLDTDKFLLSDYPITTENLEKIKIYRQQLRDHMNLQEIANYDFNVSIPNFPLFPL